jgi:glutamate synthase (NADPH/NADH) small chain
MVNKSLTKNPMPEQDAAVRRSNFNEVTLGYTEKMAIEEAQRCLQCKHKPCVAGCPVQVNIPEFLKLVAEGDFLAAYDKITENNPLPAVCGRVCPQETQCEGLCIRGKKGQPVGIGYLERFVGDYKLAHHNERAAEPPPSPSQKAGKVAVVGSGPAGLACAGALARMRHEVTIFEAFHTAGGVLIYGIPEFRLPKAIVRSEIAELQRLGVKIKTNMVIGRIHSLDELLQDGFDAVFIGSGAGLPSFLNVEGENLNGVYSANEFLTRINMMKAYRFPEYDTPVKIGRTVAVVGGGNVAMDAARSAKRLGADNVYIIYRRSEAEMPARVEEIHHAKEEGIIFKLLNNPTRIIGSADGAVTGIECVEMELGEPDASGRRRPTVKKGSEHVIDVESVVVAIGQSPNPLLSSTTPDLDIQKWGGIIVNEETCATSKDGVYAGGDAVTGAATVILAMGAGKKAAQAIDERIRNRKAES